MNTTLHTLTGCNIQGVLLRPVNVHMAASLNRLHVLGCHKVNDAVRLSFTLNRLHIKY